MATSTLLAWSSAAAAVCSGWGQTRCGRGAAAEQPAQVVMPHLEMRCLLVVPAG